MSNRNTKLRLLEVAHDLIWENSYGSVSVDDICEKAAVAKGSFYHAFKSKSELAVAAIENHWEQKRPALDQLFSTQTPPLERLKRYCDFTVANQLGKYETLGKVAGCPFSSVGCELSTQDENIRQKAHELNARMVKYFTSMVLELIAEGTVQETDAIELAKEMCAYITGVMTQAKIDNELKSVQRMLPGLLRLMGIQKAI
jgi:TetR/AcrR family transcriptional repressor of nem operon